jgi:hypothetical protein
MLLKLPRLQISNGGVQYSPSLEGTSIFAMMPAVLYLFKGFKIKGRGKFNAWVVGAWTSVVLSMGLLLFYHNTGAWQLGYRYVLDFILPLLLLLAIGVGNQASQGFKLLAILGIAGNLVGILWWFQKL